MHWLCPFVGVVLGDIPTALTFGALAELAYMGFGVEQAEPYHPIQLDPESLVRLWPLRLNIKG